MQERQFPPFDSENQTPAERRVLRRVRARRAQPFALGVGVSVLALFAVGCPGPADLANPQDYPVAAGTTSTGGGATAGTGTGGGTSPATCETDCVKDIFQKQQVLCKLCHQAKAAPDGLQSAGLNLEADGFTDRLKNVPAKHTDLPMGKTECTAGDKLIDTANPSASWLLKKIQGKQGNCGDPMPSSGMLSATQKTCMETYISCVAGGSITGGGGAPGGGTSSGGTGGTASAGTASGGTATAGTASGGSGGAKGGSGGTGGT